jgi:hypothetical protein
MLAARRVAVAAMLFLAVDLGCGHEPTRPPVTSILMSLSAAPSAGTPASPVTFNLRVTNAGQTQVWYCQGCGCGNRPDITVLGPDGNAVRVRDPAPQDLRLATLIGSAQSPRLGSTYGWIDGRGPTAPVFMPHPPSRVEARRAFPAMPPAGSKRCPLGTPASFTV